MIRYTLRCDSDHSFDSWFASADAFDDLNAAGRVGCPDCGSTAVAKSLMAPSVSPTRGEPAKQTSGALTKPRDPREAALAELKKHIEKNSDYVGMNFAAEARKIHDGDAPERSIYGEAKVDEAKKLLEDGVPVAPLPFTPKSRAN